MTEAEFPRLTLWASWRPKGERCTVKREDGTIEIRQDLMPDDPIPGLPWLCGSGRARCNHRTREEAIACPHFKAPPRACEKSLAPTHKRRKVTQQ